MVTADDFGLSEPLNEGIVYSHREGIVRSTALLISGPAKDHALKLSRLHPTLEIGLHLAFVESLATTAKRNSLSDPQNYFDGGPCLHRNWKAFLARWFQGRIRRGELQEELESQFQAFLQVFPSIPFVNSTQHLHLLPGLAPMVLELCKKYRVGALRVLRGKSPGPRQMQSRVLSHFSESLAKKTASLGIHTAQNAFGFSEAGRVSETAILRYLNQGTGSVFEIIGHPGYDDPALFSLYPGAFQGFEWKRELEAFCSQRVKQELDARQVALIRFQDL